MFNVKKLYQAVEELGQAKNVSKEKIDESVIQGLEKAYIRILTGGNQPEDLPDPRVKVVLDEKNGTVDFYQIKTIKKEVTDDMLEIDLEDAQDILNKKDLSYDQDVEIKDENVDINELSKTFIKQFKNIFHQRLNDAEKNALYEAYKDHIGEIVIGEVEKVEDRAITVKIGNNSVYLPRKEMIGDETFTIGQQIKLYLDDCSTDKKGSISVTRAAPGFLKRLFEEEIHEVYDGTIIIKNIARKAGKRSKVAVYSNDFDVDATGSCIGKDGGRINKIVNQLGGNGRDKEKIDIVAYSDNPSLYIIDALRPAEVVGINIDQDDENAKEATCIVKDGQYSKAIGLRGVNVRLAVQLTGYDLTILEETAAKEEGLKYTTKEELDAKEAERIAEAKKNEFAKQSLAYKEEKEKEAQEELKKVEANAIASKAEAKAKKEEAKKIADAKNHVSSLEEELAKAKAFASKAQEHEAEHVEIKTTTNVLDLEKQLEQEKEAAKKVEKKSSKPRKITEAEIPNEVKKDETKEEKKDIKKMDIYTEEELREMEEEEENINENDESYDDEDVDYDEYDEYYDDEK